MSKSWALVSPASRGIGLCLAKRLLENTDLPVVATARSKLDGVKDEILTGTNANTKKLKVLKVDVTGG